MAMAVAARRCTGRESRDTIFTTQLSDPGFLSSRLRGLPTFRRGGARETPADIGAVHRRGRVAVCI